MQAVDILDMALALILTSAFTQTEKAECETLLGMHLHCLKLPNCLYGVQKDTKGK